jgi:anti-sigma B factor antagonist
MDIALTPTGSQHAVLAVNGRLDLASAGLFRAAVGHAVDDGTTRLVVDLHHVHFIDSSGLGALLGAFRMARDADGDLRIAAPIPDVLDILTLMRLDRVLHPYQSIDDAFEGL